MRQENVAGMYPDHIAIIMDGNGRWAEVKGKGRRLGKQIAYFRHAKKELSVCTRS